VCVNLFCASLSLSLAAVVAAALAVALAFLLACVRACIDWAFAVRVHACSQFKKRAPRAIREIVKFVKSTMGTEDVRVDPLVNKYVWSQGIRNVPKRIRVRLHRKRNEDEEAQEKLYTHVTFVSVPTFKSLETKIVKDDE
jgi:large subunit ribosomal protein L31e